MGKAKSPRKKILIIVLVILAVLLALYVVLCNVIVSACLVPSFMEKLDAFEEITESSLADQVKTDDITQNRRQYLAETSEWLNENPPEKLSVTTSDGYKLIAGLFIQAGESHDWVILFHGYTGWKEEMYPFAKEYYEMGYNVLVPDQRCQGESEGDFIGMGLTDSEDSMLWINLILENDPGAEIILHGQSMGAATALMISGRDNLPDNIKAVISDCAYTDAYTMFGDKITEWFSLPAFPIVDSSCLMLRLRGGYNLKDASPVTAIASSEIPTLIIHGDSDSMINVSMAYSLYESASCERDIMIVEGAGHAQAYDKDPEAFMGKIWEFLDEWKK